MLPLVLCSVLLAALSHSQRLTYTTGTITHHRTTFQVTMNTRRPVNIDLTTTVTEVIYTDPIPTEQLATVIEILPYPFVGQVTTINGQQCQVSDLTRTHTVFETVVVTGSPDASSSATLSEKSLMSEFEDIWTSLNVIAKRGTRL